MRENKSGNEEHNSQMDGRTDGRTDTLHFKWNTASLVLLSTQCWTRPLNNNRLQIWTHDLSDRHSKSSGTLSLSAILLQYDVWQLHAGVWHILFPNGGRALYVWMLYCCCNIQRWGLYLRAALSHVYVGSWCSECACKYCLFKLRVVSIYRKNICGIHIHPALSVNVTI